MKSFIIKRNIKKVNKRTPKVYKLVYRHLFLSRKKIEKMEDGKLQFMNAQTIVDILI